MEPDTYWHEELRPGEGPLIAIAPHAGTRLDPELEPHLTEAALSSHWRLHAPWTGSMTSVAPTRIVALRSRYELELDESREACAGRQRVAGAPDLRLWRSEPPEAVLERARFAWDAFHEHLGRIIEAVVAMRGHFIALVLRAPHAIPENAPHLEVPDMPEIIVQSGSLVDLRYQSLARRLTEQLGDGVVLGYPLEVREDAHDPGGHLTSWINRHHGAHGCAIAVELRKVVVDDASGLPERFAHAQITDQIRQAARSVLDVFDPTPTGVLPSAHWPSHTGWPRV